MLKYVAKYFEKTVKISEKFHKNTIITMQFFQRFDDVKLCGINEVIALLKTHTEYQKYKITYLPEGTIVNKKDVVLELEGPYHLFGTFEGVIDGILSRQTSLATNAYHIRSATNKKIIFMGDRADHYTNQKNDGYAIAQGGISTHVTDAQITLHNGKAVGTVPHALIQMFSGDIIAAHQAYHQVFPNEKIVGLVDFDNDVIGDSLKLLNTFGNKLDAVRVDTSKSLSDKMFEHNEEYGVTPNMIQKLRYALDQHNGQNVKIIVSSGFDLEKIKYFESLEAPVDIYGVGASLLKINVFFTADAVRVNGQNVAKKGREYKEINQNECITISPNA